MDLLTTVPTEGGHGGRSVCAFCEAQWHDCAWHHGKREHGDLDVTHIQNIYRMPMVEGSLEIGDA